jgi:hypothetical protein
MAVVNGGHAMAPGEDPINRAPAAAPTGDGPYQELLAITVELTWFLLGALGPTTPIGVVIDIIMAVADQASTTPTPVHRPEGQPAVATSPVAIVAAPVATPAASPAPPLGTTATTQDTSQTLAAAHAVGHELASAVATAATLDRILAAGPGDAARLLLARGQLAADIDHLGIASSRLTAMPSVARSQSPAVIVKSLRDQAIVTLPMPYQAVAEQPVVVPTGRTVSAATVPSSPAIDHYRHASVHDAYDSW